MTPVAAQSSLEAIRDHFEQGGSPFVLLYASVAILVLLGLLVLVHRLQQRGSARTPTYDPKKLFSSVVRELGLPVVQRDLLRLMISDLRLEHPTLLLLSPAIFTEHALRWAAAENKLPDAAPSVLPAPLERLSEALFGSKTVQTQVPDKRAEESG